LHVDLYTNLDRGSRAITVDLDCLRYLGIDRSPHPTAEHCLRKRVAYYLQLLKWDSMCRSLEVISVSRSGELQQLSFARSREALETDIPKADDPLRLSGAFCHVSHVSEEVVSWLRTLSLDQPRFFFGLFSG
jgi:hypothetical protein